MKSKITILGSLTLLCLLFSGCSPVYETSYTYKPPESFKARQCVNQCLSQKSQCGISCDRNYQFCRAEADQVAKVAYKSYIRQKEQSGETPFRTLSSFTNYSGCNKNCDCISDYNACYSNCGGRVNADTQCVANCDKVKQQ